MTLADLFTEPTIGIYRECTGRDRIDRHWWKVTKDYAAEAAVVLFLFGSAYGLARIVSQL